MHVNLCFDEIEKLVGKHDEGGNTLCKYSHKSNHIGKEEGYNIYNSYFNHFHYLIPHFPKVDINKFDGSDPTGWID
jgi:hypothetical protein